MSKNDTPTLKTKVDMKKIGVAGKKKKKPLTTDSSDDDKPKNVVAAAMNLAKMNSNIEDQKQVEAELLSKLLSHSEVISAMSENQKSSMNLK